MNPKTKLKIRTAVSDYQKMFPDEYQLFLVHMKNIKQGLKQDMAGLTGSHAIGRHLTEVPEKLSIMIAKKLDGEELISFKEIESMRWFAKEFPQFRVSKNI